MRTVQGRVIVKETGVGVGGVVVIAHDSKERIGSAATDDEGRFQIPYALGPDGRTWTLSVDVVSEDATGQHVLYRDAKPRAHAGAVESYSIRIAHAALLAADVHLPEERRSPALARAALQLNRAKEDLQAADALAKHTAAQIETSRTRRIQVEARVVDELLARNRSKPPRRTGVLDEVVAKTRHAIAQLLGPHPRRAVLPISATQREQLLGNAPPGAPLPGTAVERFLFGAPPGERIHHDLLAVPCRDHRPLGTDCAGSSSGGGTEPPPEPAPPGPFDLHDEVARVLRRANGLDGPGRPGASEVGANVAALELRPGPADAQAQYDFQVLHLALDDVWRDLVDDDLVATATVLEQVLARSGVVIEPTKVRISDLQREARSVLREAPSGALSGGMMRRERDRDHRGRDRTRDHRDGTPTLPHPVGAEPIDDPLEHLRDLLDDLEQRLAAPYRFTVFGADETGNAINFGFIATYRQTWQPLPYQAGKLVKTVTLAPKEERSYSRKVVENVKRKTETKEKFRSLRKTEDTETSRASRDIVETALRRTGFEASYSGAIGSASVSAEASKTSSDTKQSFREAVRRASNEYETERAVDVTFEASTETTSEESGKLVNPNDELAVTYLFYEIQRRYRISERIHRLTPVILVAQPVPAPHEITIGWILQHDWILRRVLLDASFAAALRYVAESLAGEEVQVGTLQHNVVAQRQLVATIQQNLSTVRSDLGQRYAALERAIRDRSAVVAENASEGFLEKGIELFTGGDGEKISQSRLREQMARDAYERVQARERDLSDRLDREASLLTMMTDKWIEAQRSYLDKTVEVQRLRLHIKQNILYYMQAIWEHEPPDQRYLRIRELAVPRIEGSLTYQVVEEPDAVPMPPTWITPTVLRAQLSATVTDQTDPLVGIADIDRPLGFKANYAIFPLRTSHILTNYMMVPFANAVSGVHDPDDLGNFSRAALDEYVCCLQRTLSPEDFAAIRPGIDAAYLRLLADPRPSEEVIIVPSDSLYIEALPASRPILEDFKLRHRAVDVAKAEAEWTRGQLENLRRGARILANELADPDIEKTTLVEGGAGVVVDDE